MNNKKKFNNKSELFNGTAEYYKNYRVPYPKILVESLTNELNLKGTGKLLDVGCGTGEVIKAIGGKFARVLGIDPDQGMLTEAQNRAIQLGFKHVELRNLLAEDISSIAERFHIVTFGASFHWTNRILTAKSIMETLEHDGAIVLLGSNSPWTGSEKWQGIALERLQSYLGKERRAGQGYFEESSLRHQEILEKAGFTEVKTVEFDIPYTWTLDNFIGYLYSTSFASKEILGNKAAAFEKSLREALLKYDSKGEYQENMKFYYIVGWKPQRNN